MTKSQSLPTTLAQRLRLAREQAGLSQAQVAKLLGYHRPSVSEMEAGRRRVTAEELSKLADAYGVTTSWLLAESPDSDDLASAKVELVARTISKLTPEDLDRLLRLLAAFRGKAGTRE